MLFRSGYRSRPKPFHQRLRDKLLLRDDTTPPRIVSDGQSLLLDSFSSGDEPYMLASNLRDVVVLVDKDRVKAGRYAVEKLGCDTLLLDDGFQYWRLRGRRTDVVLVDSQQPFGNGFMLPRGTLREPPSHLRRANVVFLTKVDRSTAAGAAASTSRHSASSAIPPLPGATRTRATRGLRRQALSSACSRPPEPRMRTSSRSCDAMPLLCGRLVASEQKTGPVRREPALSRFGAQAGT